MTLEGYYFRKRFLECAVLLLVCFLLGSEAVNSTATDQTKVEVETEKPAPILTGNPQKDYIHDPNLPRELKGYNLSDYPFYKRVPNVDFNFSCEARKDGFYASIPHKCQVYHHCLFEVRYDFLCANYTAFDQSKFICHFANEVDCENSEMYFDRNDALYVEETTTTTTTAAPQVKIVYVERNPGRRPNRRKTTTVSPTDDYYYDYDYVYNDGESSVIATTAATTTTTSTTTVRPKIRRRPDRPLRMRPKPEGDQLSQSPDYPQYDIETPQRRPSRIRGGSRIKQQQQQLNQQSDQQQPQKKRKRRRRKKTTTTTTTTTPAPEYYDEYYYDDEYYDAEASSTTSSTTTTQKPVIRRRPDQTSRLTVQDRRKALLQSRKTQVQRFARPTPPKSQTNESKPQSNYEYDDTVYTDYTS
ncbi:UNVERIFIED_CONTAM: hypothetical protein RMT77_013245 [Armadillidium vulgare]